MGIVEVFDGCHLCLRKSPEIVVKLNLDYVKLVGGAPRLLVIEEQKTHIFLPSRGILEEKVSMNWSP